MTTARPPRTADWLLRRLATGPKRQSLIGDLHEQFQRGRSVTWYWQQTLKSILAGVTGDLQRHPGAVVHALCAGWGAFALYRVLIESPSSWLLQRLALDHQTVQEWGVIFPWSWLPLVLVGGWIVGRVIVRFHRAQLAAALFVVILSGIVTNLPRLFTLSTDAWGYPNYRAQLAYQLAAIAVSTLGIVIGGLSDQRSSKHTYVLDDQTTD